MDNFLEKELLSKEELERRKNAKRLDGKTDDPVQAFKNADTNKDGYLNKQEFLKSNDKTNRQWKNTIPQLIDLLTDFLLNFK